MTYTFGWLPELLLQLVPSQGALCALPRGSGRSCLGSRVRVRSVDSPVMAAVCHEIPPTPSNMGSSDRGFCVSSQMPPVQSLLIT